MAPRWYVPRRTILRGLGTGVALPFLEAMVKPKSGRTATVLDPQKNPRRFVGIWGLPCGLVGKWDPIQNSWVAPWTPTDRGGPLAKPEGAKPYDQGFLAPFWDPQNQGINSSDPLSSKLTILTGLSDLTASHDYVSMLLTPGRYYCQADLNDCHQDISVRGPSADQVVARYQGQFTDIPLLALGTLPPRPTFDYPKTLYLSWKSATVPEEKIIDPIKVFDKLFANAVDAKEDPATAARRKLYRKSVMHTILGHAKSLQARVGKQDQSKLAQYFDGINELEKNIDMLGKPLTCTPPAAPPTFGSQEYKVDIKVKLMTDLMVKAFECDRTRVATLTYVNAVGTTPTWLGLSGPHHDMSHYDDLRPDNAGTPAERLAYMDKWGKWVVSQYAYLARELDRRLDPDGNTLLDNSAIYMGGDFGDSSLHSSTSMNSLLLGRGGRTSDGAWAIKAGRHVRVSPPWPAHACRYDTPDHQKTFCKDPQGTYYEYYNMPDRSFDGEVSVKDLLWGMLGAIGVPEAAARAWAAPGIAHQPLDLTFPNVA